MLLHYLVAYYEVQAVFWWPPQLRQLKQEPIPRAVVVAQAVAYQTTDREVPGLNPAGS